MSYSVQNLVLYPVDVWFDVCCVLSICCYVEILLFYLIFGSVFLLSFDIYTSF